MTTCLPGRMNPIEFLRFTSKYTLGKTLVETEFNTVSDAIAKNTGETVIIKTVFHEKDHLKEANLLRKLQNVPGVVDLLDHFQTHPSVHLLIIKKFGGLSLRRFIKKYGPVREHKVWELAVQIIQTVELCASKNIIHTQLSPANLVLDPQRWRVKLTNFNAATYDSPVKFDAKKRRLGLYNSPPEYYTHKYFTSDGLNVWSIGNIIYELLFAAQPFHSVQDIIHKDIIFPQHQKNISLNVKLFIEWSLEKNIVDRMKFKQMLHHPWVTKKY